VLICGDPAWKLIVLSTYNCVAAITVDPLTEVETCAGELTLAPSAGEVIVTSAPDVGVEVVEADEELPVELPDELLPVLFPELELEPEGGVVALLPEVLAPDPGLLLPIVLELPTDALADWVELLKAPEPPHPTITVVRNSENTTNPCHIRPPRT
jgi:hypothetical protein